MGVTNLFFIKALAHWPNILAVAGQGTSGCASVHARMHAPHKHARPHPAGLCKHCILRGEGKGG